ncbi:MAG TPA: SDR family NAD(P)-dependent oxidoreductase [Chloroflexota bacterium]|nr:SDR family NAD(P)-dependent oxidoreductase [Chloroflexota bacterium]
MTSVDSIDVTQLPELPQKLAGKVALVTGAARGLGRAYALRLARLGADVVVNDISLDAHKQFDEPLTPGCETVVDEIRMLDRRSLGVVADVTDEGQVRAMVERVVRELGRIDVLVCNAGGALIPGRSLASEVPIDDFKRMLDLNLIGTLHVCQAAAPHMKAQRSGKIVTVGSQAGLRSQGGGGGTSYSVAKAAVQHYTRKLASELGPFNVNVNCIAPGWILSSRAIAAGRGSAESRARLEEEIALKRLGEPEDCAKVVEFLTTDLSDYVQGQIIPICGGVCLF